MLGYALAAAAGAFAFTVMFQTVAYQSAAADTTQTAALAGNMLNYSQRVAAYAAANPATSGAVPDSALSLPAWYQKAPGVFNYVDAGYPYVYLPGTQPGLPTAIVTVSKATVHVGIKAGTSIALPAGQPAFPLARPLPAVIPDGATVIVP